MSESSTSTSIGMNSYIMPDFRWNTPERTSLDDVTRLLDSLMGVPKYTPAGPYRLKVRSATLAGVGDIGAWESPLPVGKSCWAMSCHPAGEMMQETSDIISSLSGSVLALSWLSAALRLPITAAEPSSPTALPKPSMRVAMSCSCLTFMALAMALPASRKKASLVTVRSIFLVNSTATPTSVADTATLLSTKVSVVISMPSVRPKAVTPGSFGELNVSSMPGLPDSLSKEPVMARTSSFRVSRSAPMTFS